MRSRRLVIAAIFTALLVGGAVVAYAYDRAQRQTVARGITVAGVPIGGLEAAEARATLERELLPRLGRPVRAVYRRSSFALPPRRAGVAVDLDAIVADALEHSRGGTLVTRLARAVTGGSVDAELRPHLTYERRAVERFVGEVRRRLDRPPVDARVKFSGRSLRRIPGRRGIAIDARQLRRAVARALTRVGDGRAVEIRARTTRPAVTVAALTRRYPTVITIDRARFRLHLWKRLRRVKSYPVALGQVGLDTPAGLYKIQNKAVDPVWSVPNSAWAGSLAGQQIPPGPSNPIKARWLGIFDGAGIHGTDAVWSLGTAASHGCVRMAIADVVELYDKTPVGTPIYVG